MSDWLYSCRNIEVKAKGEVVNSTKADQTNHGVEEDN